MVYSNAIIFCSEVITTAFAIYLADTVVANELLAGTKGHSMVSMLVVVFVSLSIAQRPRHH
jgi:hypothetical protein